MKVELLTPDAPRDDMPSPTQDDAIGGFARALDAAGEVLNAASDAEDAYAAGRGPLEAAVYARARADVTISVASAAAQRAAQAVQTLMNLQV